MTTATIDRIDARLGRIRARLETGSQALNHLGPTKVLERGYSITCLDGTTIPLKDATRVHGGQSLVTRLARGEVRSLVSSTTIQKRIAQSGPSSQPSLFDDHRISDEGSDNDGAHHE